MNSLAPRLAVCTWSLQSSSPAELVDRVLATGVRRVQLGLDPLRQSRSVWGDTAARLADAGIAIASGMFGTVGEDYTSLETIRATGGIVPDATWDENWRNIRETLYIARELRLKLVTFHAGFLPHDPADASFGKLIDRLRRVAELFGSEDIQVGLETGQETGETLDDFLAMLACGNVGVNFDPANILLYDKGDPISALRRLSRWLRQVHIKDALRTRVPGTWGDEVVVGTGQVDWPLFFETLDSLAYVGDLCIEREAGTQRVADIQAAAGFVTSL